MERGHSTCLPAPHARSDYTRLAGRNFPTVTAPDEGHAERYASREIGLADCLRATALVGTYSFLINFIEKGGVIFLRRFNFQKKFVEARTGDCNSPDHQEAKERRQSAAFKPGCLPRS